MAGPSDNPMLRYWMYEPDLGGDSDWEPTTADIRSKHDAMYGGPGGWLRSARDAIPESPNTFSALNMVRSGLGTAANWLQGTPEIGPDTIAPLGLAPMGMALTPRNAVGSSGGKLASSLPMDEASRLNRAREMGFDEQAWYHGTNSRKPFESFDLNKVGSNLGVDPDAEKAIWLSPSKTQARIYGKEGGVLPLKVNHGRQKVIEPPASGYRQFDHDGFNRILAQARADGYDSVLFRKVRDEENLIDDQLAVFEPKNIRRLDAAFDPTQSHSANLLASDTTRSSVPGTVVNAMADAAEPKGITAYHGSPHDFDRFDMSKIGTGEGAQAYGHGLYFAEAEGVAKQYRDQLGDYSNVAKWKGDQPPTPLQEKFLKQLGGPDQNGQPMTVDKLKGEIARTIRQEQAAAEGAYGVKIPEAAGRAKRLLEEWHELDRVADKIEVSPPSGRLYEVRIKADPESFLDWDKPLKDQPAAVQKFYNDQMAPKLKTREIGNNPNIGPLTDVFQEGGGSLGVFTKDNLQDVLSNPAKYSPARGSDVARGQEKVLRDAGIPGIKYLDQGSRQAGEGSRNYVIFDADKIEILKKYGWVPVATVGGGTVMMPPAEEKQNRMLDQ